MFVQSPPSVDVRPSDGAGQELYQERGRTACPSSSETNERRVVDVQEVKSAQDEDRKERCRLACQRSRKRRKQREDEMKEELVRMQQLNARLRQHVVELERKLGCASGG